MRVPPASTRGIEPSYPSLQNSRIQAFPYIDNTAAMQAIIDDAPAGSRLDLWQGTYRCTDTITINKPLTLKGRGTAVWHNDDDGVLYPATGRIGSSFPAIDITSPGVTIDGITFIGNNNPFGGIDAFTSAWFVIYCRANDITIQNCTFKWILNHCVREPGVYSRVHVKNCTVFQCGNAINVNADDSIQTGNYVEQSNGLECAGTRPTITDNVFIDSHGISVGGNGNGLAGQIQGGVISRNIITRPVRGTALALAGTAGCTIEDNVITDASYGNPSQHGIQKYDSTATNVPGWIDVPSGADFIRRNTVTIQPAGGHMMIISNGDGTVIEDNVLVDPNDGGFGLIVSAANNCIFRRNTVDGRAGDIHFEPPAAMALNAYITGGGNTGNITKTESGGATVTYLPVP